MCAAPALAQQQIDPSVLTNIPPEDLHDFKGFLDQVMDDIMAANGPTVLNAGNTLWRGLAAIVVVWTGIKIAMSGTFSMWALIELVIGLWIPWVMLLFYPTPIPGVGFTFPGMIAGGGNWLHSFFISDIVPAVQIELANLVHTQTTAISDAWAGTSWFELYAALGQPRYFALKLPIAVDEQAATFVYVDAGRSTDSELRAWGVAHAQLWAALRAGTFAVHVVAVGTGAEAADRAAPVLTRWT